MFLQNIKAAEYIFGPAIPLYSSAFNEALPELLEQEYVFVPDDVWAEDVQNGRLTSAEIGRFFWLETLQRVQLTSVITLLRTASWINSCVREYEAGSISGWAAACRSLLEGVGDSGDALNHTAVTLAEHAVAIREELSGRGIGRVSEDLDQTLIRFSHGRHVPRGDTAPAYHKAKSSGEHIAIVASMGLQTANSFYGVLCELTHPAQASMAHLYNPTPDGFRLSTDGEPSALQAIVTEHRSTLHQLLPLAFNPALLALRVVAGFGVLTSSVNLSKLDLSPILVWSRITAGMRSAGLEI